jgi:outer membrane immunogenic protein
MKKLILGAAVAMSSLAFAQQFGVKGGMNVSSLSEGSNIIDQTEKISFNAGVFYNVPVAKNFSVQTEILYSELGSKVTLGDNSYSPEYSRNLGYISAPVMFQYNATPRFYLEAGPQVSVLVSANDKLESDLILIDNNLELIDNNLELDTDRSNNYSTFDFGVGLGAGYYFTPNLGLTARYTVGLTDIIKNNTGDNVKNNLFQVGLAYKFAKK